MRLLRRDHGTVSLTKDLSDAEAFKLKYAILSHTWGPEEEEVTIEDVRIGDTSKVGWQKIQFCIDQGARDGLEYFWVDTCCIDKRNETELSKSLRSMFRWYAHADRCYVHLSDTADLHACRWFTRGWTLQELIAPVIVEFFWQGQSIGTKTSLEDDIFDVTGIPISVLRGTSLSEYSPHARLQWQEGRSTKEPEDLVYSLFGILDVSMPVLYGEGLDRARERLDRELNITQPTLSVPPSRTLRSMEVAEATYTSALRAKEQGLGYHISTLQTLHDLGTLYLQQGRPADAQELLERALVGREDLLGPKHISTLETVHQLGVLYMIQMQITKSDRLLSRALEGREEALGVNHASTLDSVSQVALLDQLQGKLAQAEAGFMRVLQVREAAHGLQHITTLSTVHDLGVLSMVRFKFPEAIKKLQQALAGRERLLGWEHTDTQASALTLGRACIARGTYIKGLLAVSPGKAHEATAGMNEQSFPDANAVVELLTKALAGREKALGPHHPSTLQAVEGLAVMYESHDHDLAKTEELYLRIQRSNQHTNRLPPEHPRAMYPLQRLARLKKKQGKLEEAEQLLKQCCKAYAKLDKPCPFFDLAALDSLGGVYKEQARFQDAEIAYLRVLSEGAKIPQDHYNIFMVLATASLMVIYVEQSRFGEAKLLYDRARVGHDQMDPLCRGLLDIFDRYLRQKQRRSTKSVRFAFLKLCFRRRQSRPLKVMDDSSQTSIDC